MFSLPRRVAGSQENLSNDLVISILLDRNVLLEFGRGVLLILTAEETAALYTYLHKNKKKFVNVRGGE